MVNPSELPEIGVFTADTAEQLSRRLTTIATTIARAPRADVDRLGTCLPTGGSVTPASRGGHGRDRRRPYRPVPIAPTLVPVTPPEARGRLVTLSVTAFAVVISCILLGAWQFGRVQRPVDGYSSEPTAVPLDQLVHTGSPVPSAVVARQVTVSGTYDAAAQSIESGHLLDGQAVDWIVTPLVLADATRVLVIRGWVNGPAQSLTRPPDGLVTLTGRLEQGTVATGAVTGVVRSGYLVRTAQSPPDPLSLQPVPVQPPGNTAPDELHVQNAIYVVQWWLFAAMTVFTWWRLVHPDEAAPSEGPLSPADVTRPSMS